MLGSNTTTMQFREVTDYRTKTSRNTFAAEFFKIKIEKVESFEVTLLFEVTPSDINTFTVS